MALALGTLGVAHPPGYPLYTVIGAVFADIPLGNLAYRANIFSALAGAVALGLFYLLLRTWLSRLASSLAAACLGFSHPFWEVTGVSEMYALGALWIILILWAIFRMENTILAAFLLGLGLGVRMDLLLAVPMIGLWLWWTGRLQRKWRHALFFILGTSVFLYLPIRSLQNPLLDWANPDTVGRLMASITRESYSGTLDLLSLSYKKGENFSSSMALYAVHLWKGFQPWGILLMLVGVVSSWRLHRAPAVLGLAIFIVTGPLFLFLANMPPNPHANAIVEASFLPPDIMSALALGFGAQWLASKRGGRVFVIAVLCLALGVNARAGWERASKRGNFITRDYVATVSRSLSREAVLILHEDVQLFSFWYAALSSSLRPSVGLVATGLSASPWYWDMMRRWPTASVPGISVKRPAGWVALRTAMPARRLFASLDTDVPDIPEIRRHAHGAVTEIAASESRDPEDYFLLREFSLLRAGACYGETPDFFTTDLIGDYSRMYHEMGVRALLEKNWVEGLRHLRQAESLEPGAPRPTADRAYIHFSLGDYVRAANGFATAIEKTKEMLRNAERYKALPDVAARLRLDLAGLYVSMGGSFEKMGDKKGAREAYETSLSVEPTPGAHYNLAVTYWNDDWPRVVRHLESVLALNPNYPDADRFLRQAASKLRPDPR